MLRVRRALGPCSAGNAFGFFVPCLLITVAVLVAVDGRIVSPDGGEENAHQVLVGRHLRRDACNAGWMDDGRWGVGRDWLIGWLIGWLLGWLLGWLVGWLVARSVGWLLGRLWLC